MTSVHIHLSGPIEADLDGALYQGRYPADSNISIHPEYRFPTGIYTVSVIETEPHPRGYREHWRGVVALHCDLVLEGFWLSRSFAGGHAMSACVSDRPGVPLYGVSGREPALSQPEQPHDSE